jgi:hypothetical protein
MDYDRIGNLRRRVYCLERHIAYLEHLLIAPESCLPELERRRTLIQQAEETIRLHRAAIERTQSDCVYASDLIVDAKRKLMSLKREANTHLIEKLKNEYFHLKEELDVSVDPSA